MNSKRARLYSKPKLDRFGTLRELTLAGFGADGDGFILGSDPGTDVDGCEYDPFGTCGRS